MGALSNRDDLNLLLVLEIPHECFNSDHPQKLFEQATEGFDVFTTYFGENTLDRVIPSQYIKCGIISLGGGEMLTIHNPQFDSDYEVKDGVYELATLEQGIENIKTLSYDYARVQKVMEMILSNIKQGYCSSPVEIIDAIIEVVENNKEMDVRNPALLETLCAKREEIRKALLTPLEIMTEEIEKKDYTAVTVDEFKEMMKEYFKLAADSIKNNASFLHKPIEVFSRGLDAVYDKTVAMPDLNNDETLDIFIELNYRMDAIYFLEKEHQIDRDLICEKLYSDCGIEALGEDYEKRYANNTNRIFLLNSALSCKDFHVVKNIMEYLRNHDDLSSYDMEQCHQILDSLMGLSKEAHTADEIGEATVEVPREERLKAIDAIIENVEQENSSHSTENSSESYGED